MERILIINKNIKDYIVSVSSSVQSALKKINENKHKIVYIVDGTNHLLGALTDGDVRRWMLTTQNLNLEAEVASVMNSSCFSLNSDSVMSTIEASFSTRITSIPLVDCSGHLISVAEPKASYISIGNKQISEEGPVFIIAEIGNNHQGDISLAKKLVDFAVEAEVDCVKFQMRNVSELYKYIENSDDPSADLGAQYTLDLLSKFELKDDELFEVFDYCKEKGVIPLCTPWDLSSLKKLEDYGMLAYKASSADFTNYELLESLARTGKPLICSTGMTSEAEIQSTVAFLKRKKAQFILLHCNSTYPTPFKDVNLNYLQKLKTTASVITGYSGHERGWAVPIAAVALGAKVIEKHFTLDRSLEGNDHKVSLLPNELNQMVVQLREVEESLGSSVAREATQGELLNREVLAKSLTINCELKAGEVIKRNMIEARSPGQGLQPNRVEELVGRMATRDFRAGDIFFNTDINKGKEKKDSYEFSRPFGIPVRYHDFSSLTENINLDFVEFHLSYKDLDVDISEFVPSNQSISLAVHAPELFPQDHLLDLGSFDFEYRLQSIKETQKVIDHALELSARFPKTDELVVVVNVGGWDSTGFISKVDKLKKYDLVKNSFSRLNLTGVKIAIQTMPPFPWHFGGQSYHNLFLDPDEIKSFCEDTGLSICLDVSHSMMACNYYNWDLYQFVEKISPYIVHMHIVDAKGVDGEGVQIGEGDVDFKRLGAVLLKELPDVQFIPEVWQGHKNKGEGFWNALDYLEKVL